MAIELLDVVEYGLKTYKNKELGNRFGLIDYYSLTDIPPRELSVIARNQDRITTSVGLVCFDNNNYFQSRAVNLEERMKFFHSVKGHELTSDEKLAIYDKLIAEGYPAVDGIYDVAVRYYVELGIDSISKEHIRNSIFSSYSKYKGLSNASNEEVAEIQFQKVLQK